MLAGETGPVERAGVGAIGGELFLGLRQLFFRVDVLSLAGLVTGPQRLPLQPRDVHFLVGVFLQTLLKIIQRELLSLDRSSWTFWRGFAGPATDVTPVTAAAAGVAAAAPRVKAPVV